MHRQLRFGLLVAVTAALTWAPAASAAPKIDSSALRDAVTVAGIREHQAEFQSIADANGGTRASGTPGFEASVGYVRDRLDAAGYDVTVQPFDFAFFQELSPAQMSQTAPTPTDYVYGTDFQTMDYSGSGDVTAAVQAVDLLLPPTGGSTSGCEASDFAGFTAGNIALIQRGTCTFNEKATNAAAAGAVGAVIFNEGNAPDRIDLLLGTLGTPVDIPVVGISFALGEEFANTTGLTLHLVTDTESEIRPTWNVIAETPGGRSDRVVVVGAHLDSVLAGPGINDNGSGSGTLLEIAEQIDELGITPRNKIRFAFWGAEESGLLGSEFYVSQLSVRDIKNIAVNLNFDMVGSPNFVRFVYDGDGSATPDAGPNGSGVVEDVFLDYFATTDTPETEPTAFDGRSDYGPFIAVGIPAGGLFTGAEGHKTAAQVAIYGGIEDEQYDPCYHEACDTFAGTGDGGGATPPGLGLVALDQMSDATAHSVLAFAQTTSAVSGTDKGSAKGLAKKLEQFQFRGSRLQK